MDSCYVFASGFWESEGSGDVTLLYLREGFLQAGASQLSIGVELKKVLNRGAHMGGWVWQGSRRFLLLLSHTLTVGGNGNSGVREGQTQPLGPGSRVT